MSAMLARKGNQIRAVALSIEEETGATRSTVREAFVRYLDRYSAPVQIHLDSVNVNSSASVSFEIFVKLDRRLNTTT
ncbi:MAG: hypothetical protein MMC23_008757 [Stictis urceolatum]|nr:hypothetical protein [Stictis urceolata]